MAITLSIATRKFLAARGATGRLRYRAISKRITGLVRGAVIATSILIGVTRVVIGKSGHVEILTHREVRQTFRHVVK